MLGVRLGFRVFVANLRRSGLAAAVVAAGSALALLLWAMAEDVNSALLESTLLQYTGHVQVVRKGYERTPDVSKDLGKFNPPSGEEVAAWTERTEAWGVAFGERTAAGALLVGLEPSESLVTSLPVPSGGVLVGSKLAKKLGVEPGDTLVFLTRDARGAMAPELLPVAGLYEGFHDLEAYGILANAGLVKNLVLAGPHRLVIRLKRPERAREFARSYNPGPGLKAVPWQEAYPAVEGMLKVSEEFINIFLLAFLILAAGSVMLTSLASYEERLRELAVIRALGGSGWALAGSVLTEGALISALGLLAGALLGVGLTLLLNRVGIDISFAEEILKRMTWPSVIRPQLGAEAFTGYLESAFTLFLAGLLGSLYPALKALRVRPAEALRA